MPGSLILSDLLLILLSAFLGGVLARKLKQPAIWGYLFSGIVVSFLMNFWGASKTSLNFLAEIGTALLMFTLGLEFSFKKSERLRTNIIQASVLWILAIIFLGSLLLHFVFKFNLKSSLIMAAAFSISSTAIVVKLLEEKGLSESLQGNIMYGSIMTQDLAVLPVLCLFTLFFGEAPIEVKIISLSKIVVVLELALIFSQKIASKVGDFVAGLKSRELLLLFSIALVFLFSMFTASFGFSLALGAFLAGLVLSQTNENLAIFSEVRPLRDVFLVIFFVSLGSSLAPSFLLANWLTILVLSGLILLLKIVLGILILGHFGYHAKTILRVSLGLAQAGEFSFTLAAVAFSGHFLDEDSYLLVISVALLTMVLTPWLFSLADILYKKCCPFLKRFPFLYEKYCARKIQESPMDELPFTNHVVILGYGRVGKWIGSLLDKAKIPYLVVEYNPHIVRRLKMEGKRVIFGDPTDIDVLDFAQVDKARLAVIAIPDPVTQRIVLGNCKTLNPEISIICRSHIEEDYQILKELGADEIVQPEFETALSMTHQIFERFGFNKEEIQKKIKEIRNDREENEKK